MTAAAGYIRSFFPLFLLGAVFGKLMETSGAAGAIAGVIAADARPAARDPGRRARLRRADLRRRLAVRRRVRGLSVRGDAVPRGRHPQATPPRRHRAGGVHAHDGRPAGLAADPEPDPDPLLRDRRLRGARGRHRSAARPSCSAACSGSSAAARGRRPPARATARGTATSPIRRSGRTRPGRSVALAIVPLLLVLVANFVLSRTGSWSVAAGTRRSCWSATSRRSTSRRPRPTWALIVALVLGIVATLVL